MRSARRRLERSIGTEASALGVESWPSATSLARLPNHLSAVLPTREPLASFGGFRSSARATDWLGRTAPLEDAGVQPTFSNTGG